MPERAAPLPSGGERCEHKVRLISLALCAVLVALSLLLVGCTSTFSAAGPARERAGSARAHRAGPHTRESRRQHGDRHLDKRHHDARHRKHRSGDPSVRSSETTAPAGSALTELDTLPVKGRAPLTGYTREEFGQAWLDADRNGCDTRNDILARYLHDITYEPGTGGCVVLSGDITDFYTGAATHFVRGSGESLDIDHVVALGDAWQTGAATWPMRKRAALANDPLNLLPVDYSANRQKGDADAASWLPSNKPYRCSYVARQVAVKAKYRLWVTPAEKAAIVRVLESCPGQPALPDPTKAPTLVPFPVAAPAAETDPRGAGGTGNGVKSSGPSGGSCEPGYSPCLPVASDLDCSDIPASERPVTVTGDDPYRLDADGDGTGCE
jgi:hypothetical protein